MPNEFKPLEKDLIEYVEKLRIAYEKADSFQKAERAQRRYWNTMDRLLPDLIQTALAYWNVLAANEAKERSEG